MLMHSVFMMEREAWNQREWSDTCEDKYLQNSTAENYLQWQDAIKAETKWLEKLEAAAQLDALEVQLLREEKYLSVEMDPSQYDRDLHQRTIELIGKHKQGEVLEFEIPN